MTMNRFQTFGPMKKTMMVALVAAATLTGASAAQAQCSSGLIADILCQTGVIDQQTANALDDAHAGLGNPLDHAAPVIADTIFPGSGALVGGIQQFNQMSPGFGAPQPVGQSPAQPTFQQPIQPQVQLGNFCLTQSGVHGPGPIQPVGSPCYTFGPFGQENGYVIR